MSDNVHNESHVSEAFGCACVTCIKTFEDFITRDFSNSDNIDSFFENALETAFNDETW